jgi:hypothetical protein
MGQTALCVSEQRVDVGIMEVGIEKGSRWVELMNVTSNAVDMANWNLALDQRTYQFPGDFPSVPPKGVVLIELSQGKGSVVGVNESGNQIRVHWPIMAEDLDAVLSRTNGTCALLRKVGSTEAELVDMVCWGETEGQKTNSSAYAGSKRIWQRNSVVYVWTQKTPGDFRWGPATPLTDKASLARVHISPEDRVRDWFVCLDDDVTKGKENTWPAPALDYGPRQGTLLKRSQVVHLGWKGKGERFRVQVAPADDFKELLVDEVVDGQVKKLDRGLDKGTYYWRVRSDDKGLTGKWSKSVRFDVQE